MPLLWSSSPTGEGGERSRQIWSQPPHSLSPTFIGLAGLLQLLQRLDQLGVLARVQVHFPQLRERKLRRSDRTPGPAFHLQVGLEPESVVLGLLQGLQRRLVELLQQLGLCGTTMNFGGVEFLLLHTCSEAET